MIRIISPPPRVRAKSIISKPRELKFRKADVRRAVDAAREGGMVIGEIEIRLDGGAIRISSIDAAKSNDDDLFARWESRL